MRCQTIEKRAEVVSGPRWRLAVAIAAKLRPGNVHSAEGWEELLLARG